MLVLAPLALAGCASERSSFAPTRTQAAAPPKPTPPPVDMAGRWLLASADGALCGMNFSAAPNATSGKIAPEGGCPGNFFTSRQWAFDQGTLEIYDHKQKVLAQLASSEPPGQFTGNAVSGIPVTLSR